MTPGSALTRNLIPHFPHLKENNVRQGFVTRTQYAKLVAPCPDLWLQAMLETACNYGWRVCELVNLRVGQVGLLASTMRLAAGHDQEPGRT